MPFTIGEIADALGAQAAGDLSIVIDAPAQPADAGRRHLALAMEPSYGAALSEGQAEAAVLWADADWKALGLKAAIFAPRSRYVLSGVTRVFDHVLDLSPGIHPTAIVAGDAELGEDVWLGPFVVVGSGAKLGAGARVMSHVTIGAGAEIGPNALIHAGARIGARVRIGARFICQPGAAIGVDGFSFVTPKPGAVEEARATGKVSEASRTEGFARINSLGTVVLGDDVEVGANATIDRGTIADTTVGNGTKLDNQVHIGHNVTVGQTCLLCGQVGIAGSTVIGDRVVLGGQVGVADHLSIGSDVIVAGKSGVSSNIPSGRVMMGNPAMKMDLNVESYKAFRRLPRLMARLIDLEKRVSKGASKD